MLSNPFNLEDKNALVTGAYQGLGFGMAQGLAEAGAHVIMADIHPEIDDQAAALRKRGLSAEGFVVDLLDREERTRCKKEIEEMLFGSLHILVNNAGIQIRHPALEFPLEDWDRVLEVNLTAAFDLAQWAGNLMMKLGRGKIINIASVNAVAAGINTVAYCTAKGGIVQMTKSMSNELSSHGINVNCIAPGYMETQMIEALSTDQKRVDELMQRIPAKRWGKPGDIAGAAVYLASEASDFVCGVMLPVDGGYLGR